MIKAKSLKNNMDFFQSKKKSMVSTTWQHILGHIYLLRKLLWILGDTKSINIWHDIWKGFREQN